MQRKAADISALIPHRGEYRFVDRVVSERPGAGIVCTKEIRGDEAYFAGHFPGRPIVPGVFEIEMMFQAARILLMLKEGEGGGRDVRLARVDNARFQNPIVPPTRLTITIEVKGGEGSLVRFSGLVTDETQRYAQATFSVGYSES